MYPSNCIIRGTTLGRSTETPYQWSNRLPICLITGRLAWKYRRIATHLSHIDQQERLHQLSAQRKTLEAQLAKAYKDVVVKRTWLKLAENASPSIRAALQAYLNAIQKIGKGTGKRAVRYRQDAKHAAEQANPAVPCWIMPHYRVSESIPCRIGMLRPRHH